MILIKRDDIPDVIPWNKSLTLTIHQGTTIMKKVPLKPSDLLINEDGSKFRLSEKLPNSQMALYMSEFAKKNGKFDEFHKLVFDNYWIQGKDIGDKDLLLDLAESVGLDKNEILNYIETDEPSKMLEESGFELGRCGINGVPTFFIGEEVVIGAQPYSIFEEAIERALQEDSA